MTNENPISEREREILRLVATGATNQQIAIALNISVNTVKVHLRNIFAKIGVESRTEATVYAIRAGIVTIGETSLASTTDTDAPSQPTAIPALDISADAPPIHLPLDDLASASTGSTPAPEGSVPPTFNGEPAPVPITRPASELQPSATIAQSTPSAPVRTTTHHPLSARLITWLIGLLVLAGLAIALALSIRTNNVSPPPVDPTQPAAVSAEQRWFTRQPLSEPRDDFALTGYDLERRLYVIGGRSEGRVTASVDRYDPETNRWVTLTDKPTAVSHARAITLRGLIFVPGGEDSTGTVTDRLEIYDPREQRWYSGAPLPAPRSRYALAAWEGQIYLMGGWDGNTMRSEVFIYDPLRDQWEEGPPLPQPRRYASAAVVGGRLYLIGGEGINGPLRDSAWLEPSGDRNRRWNATAPLPLPIARPAAVGLPSTLLVFDSERREGLSYDIAADAWSRSPLPPEANIFPAAVLLESSVYFVGDYRARGMLSEYRALYIVFIPGQ